MSRVCEICQKEYQRANLVPRGIGRRVTRRTTKKQLPNLRTKRIALNGKNKVKITMCASCLKRLKFEAKAAVAESTKENSKN